MVELKFFPIVCTQEYLDSIPEYVKCQMKNAWPLTLDFYDNQLTVDCMRTIMASYPGDFERKLRYRLYMYYDGL